MRKTQLQVFAIGLVLSLLGAGGAIARGLSDAPDPLAELAGYKQRTRETSAPIQVDFSLAAG